MQLSKNKTKPDSSFVSSPSNQPDSERSKGASVKDRRMTHLMSQSLILQSKKDAFQPEEIEDEEDEDIDDSPDKKNMTPLQQLMMMKIKKQKEKEKHAKQITKIVEESKQE